MTLDIFTAIVSPLSQTLDVSPGTQPDDMDFNHLLFAFNYADTESSVRFLDESQQDISPGQGCLIEVGSDGSNRLFLGSPFSLETGLPIPKE